MHIGLMAVPVAGVAGWLAGAAWYRVLGRRWLGALGYSAEEQARLKQLSPLAPMLFSFVGELVMALILLVVIGRVGEPRWLRGGLDGLVLWLGFVATTTSVNYAFQRRSLALLAIDGGHWLLVLAIEGALIGGLR